MSGQQGQTRCTVWVPCASPGQGVRAVQRLAVSLHAECNSIECPGLPVTLPSVCHAAFCSRPVVHSHQYSERMKELNSPAGLPASWPW